MIVDALVEADPVFKLADATENAQDFARLEDSILRVRRMHSSHKHVPMNIKPDDVVHRLGSKNSK